MNGSFKPKFGMSPDFAGRYARIVFLSRYRFTTNKGILATLTYEDWDTFASILLAYWSVGYNLGPLIRCLSRVWIGSNRW
jgi:hypothetical protein